MDRERVHVVLKTVRCVFALLAISAGTARAQAEATVRGDVVAVANGSALSGVQVTLEPQAGESRQTVTDAEGRFVFGVVRPGEYVVSARAEGFAARQVRLFVEPREVQSVRLALDVGRVAIDVDVVAGVALASTHSPSSTMLTIDRLEQMPLSQHTNLPDAIVTAAPGMVRGHDDSDRGSRTT